MDASLPERTPAKPFSDILRRVGGGRPVHVGGDDHRSAGKPIRRGYLQPAHHFPAAVHFWTPNFHPNVSDRDNIFHSMLMSDTWCIATSVAQMLMTLAQMLLHPLVGEGDVVREEVAVMYRKDRARYKELARIFTRIRAG
ncbi:ubiquitin-conjugating enzyme E2-17 kDa [Eutrema salsugineum]|uniref:ubiquitin-conjugating enzyme E2-17 kDa n=1 Tax=Eutrema salsugineum TaxID=72664 RepID=UPI000CED0AC1|nr:ubiquitin-conjugating enzyme E2-17 kDa [Eutrema salsugineum]